MITWQIVLLVCTLLSDDQCAQRMARSGVVESLIELLKAKQEDDEFVLQVLHMISSAKLMCFRLSVCFTDWLCCQARDR